MTDDAPDTLTRLLNDVPVGQPPLVDLLASGRAAKRHTSRVQVAVVACLVLVVMGGSFALSRTFGPASGDSLVADGSTGGGGLDATVEVGFEALTSRGLTGSDATWDQNAGTLLYASDSRYSSSCPPDPTLTDRDGSLSLELAHSDDVNEVCTADAVPVVVTITGLATPPEQLTVSEEGNPAKVVAVTISADSNTMHLSCPVDLRTQVDLDVPGPGQPTPEAAVVLLLPQLGQLSTGAVKVDGRQATVAVVNSDGDVVRVYSLTLRKDGWWPDGYSTCETQFP